MCVWQQAVVVRGGEVGGVRGHSSAGVCVGAGCLLGQDVHEGAEVVAGQVLMEHL